MLKRIKTRGLITVTNRQYLQHWKRSRQIVSMATVIMKASPKVAMLMANAGNCSTSEALALRRYSVWGRRLIMHFIFSSSFIHYIGGVGTGGNGGAEDG